MMIDISSVTFEELKTLKIQEAISYFENNNISITQCAKKFHIDRETFTNYLKKANVHENRSAYKIKDDIFEIIDTEEKAYWLGFMLADGCLKDRKGAHNITLILSVKDIDHINKFKTFLETEAPIHYRTVTINGKTFDACGLSIGNKKIFNDLISHNIMPRKTLSEKGAILEEHLIRHYIRGIFDGDGWLTYTNKSREMGFGMGKEILEYIKEFFESNNVYFGEIKPYGSIFRYRKSARYEVYKALMLLYDNSTIYLDRKYNKYLLCRSEIESSLNIAKQSQND